MAAAERDVGAAGRKRASLMLPAASQPDIIRANQKDAYALLMFREQVENAARVIGGNRRMLAWQHEIPVIADAIYYTLTTLAGAQTLGEEYCEIVQTSAGTRALPGFARRLALVMLQTVGPYAATKLYGRAVARAAAADPQEGEGESRTVAWMRAAKNIVQDEVPLVHLAVFYFVGTYYSIAKRLTQTTYILSRDLAPGEERPKYTSLGVLLALQLLFRARTAVLDALELSREAPKEAPDAGESNSVMPAEEDADEPVDPTEDDPQRKCSLCLSTRKSSAATQCGHLFCWECICEWCNSKAECPLCRQAITLSRILPLYNF